MLRFLYAFSLFLTKSKFVKSQTKTHVKRHANLSDFLSHLNCFYCYFGVFYFIKNTKIKNTKVKNTAKCVSIALRC